MSEEQAYYQPKAQIVQTVDRVMIVEPLTAQRQADMAVYGEPATRYVATIYQDYDSQGNPCERLGYDGQFPSERIRGREMVLVPKEPDMNRYIRIVRFRNPANGNWRHSIEIVCGVDGGEFMQVDTFYELGIAEAFANRLARMTNLPRYGDQLTPVS